jgi:hypothetical protein
MAFAATRFQSLLAAETALWNDALRRAPAGPHRFAYAFNSIADSRLLQIISRLQHRYSSDFARLAREWGRKRTGELVDSSQHHHLQPNLASLHL